MSYQQEEEEEESGVPQQVAELAEASVPQAMRGIRACKRCGILKTLDQFINEGCENCPFLDMVSNDEKNNQVLHHSVLVCLPRSRSR